jgi:hypothetical protein
VHAYIQLILSGYDCFGTWTPNTRLKVGEVGRLVGDGSFEHTGDVKSRTGEAPPPILKNKQAPIQILRGATATRSAGGGLKTSQILSALATAKAGIQVKMERHESATLILEEVFSRQFRDQRTARLLMEEMLRNNQMYLDEVLVTYVHGAGSGVVAASDERAADAEGETDLSFTEFELAKVGGRIAIASGHASNTLVQAEKGRPLTPMYRVLFFRRSSPWFAFWKKEYTVEALLRSVSSLREYRRGGRRGWRIGSYRPGMIGALADPPLPEDEFPNIVGSDLPSLAFAELALAELDEAELDFEPFEPNPLVLHHESPLQRASRLASAPAYRVPAMVEVYNNLGRVLEGLGDLRGAQEQYESALEWTRSHALGRLPHEPETASGEARSEEDAPSAEEESGPSESPEA